MGAYLVLCGGRRLALSRREARMLYELCTARCVHQLLNRGNQLTIEHTDAPASSTGVSFLISEALSEIGG